MRPLLLLANGIATISTSCNSDKTQKVFFYARGVAGGIATVDFVNISNYNLHPKSPRELYVIAKKYLDTAKSQLPIREIVIIAKNVTKRPISSDLTPIIESREFTLIAFDFGPAEQYPNSLDSVYAIEIWKNGVAKRYHRSDENDRRVFDSVVNANTAVMLSD